MNEEPSAVPVPRRSPRPLAGWWPAVALIAFSAPAGLVSGGPCQDKGTPPAELVENARARGLAFPRVELLRYQGEANSSLKDALRAGSLLRIDPRSVRNLLRTAPKDVTLALPAVAGRAVELELVKVDVVTPDFAVVTSQSDGKAVAYTPGVHYRGMVKGERSSLAAVSVFADEVMGFYRTDTQGTVVLGRLANAKLGQHVLYAESDLKAAHKYTCGTVDDTDMDGLRADPWEFASFQDATLQAPAPPAAAPDAVLAKCARIYVETDYDLYQNKGSTSAVTNYVTGLFNQSATLYSNASIPISLSQVFVWSSTSPYTASSSSSLLSQFQSYRNSFNGDLGHLLALRGGGGIAAGFAGFCNTNIDNRQCFSGISSTYSNVPTYSWTVMVFTHEMGHLMGSRHTHACVWNGNNTAIDGCAAPEGTCARPGNPSGGGTIMSYCHQQSVGINLNNGFGTQPGNVIRSRFGSASCLTDCGGGPPPSCTTYSGSLSGTGAAAIQPNGTYYQSTVSGTHSGTLTGPASADFDLFLRKWNGSAWVNVAASEGSTSSETINYTGTAGYYYWRIYSYSGSGSYSLCIKRP